MMLVFTGICIASAGTSVNYYHYSFTFKNIFVDRQYQQLWGTTTSISCHWRTHASTRRAASW